MTSKGRAHFEVVFCFISKFVVVHGEVVEKTALATLSGSPVQEFEKEIGRFIQDMILGTVAAVQESSGNIWTSHGEQRNGQDAFESKQSPATKTQIKSNELLAGILCFLNEALVYCPVFLLHLPCALGGDLTDDMLLRRAIKSAVAGLYDSDLEITRSAITFLKTLVRKNGFLSMLISTSEKLALTSSFSRLQAQHYFSRHASVQSYVSESLCKIRADAIGRLVLGSCGKYEHKVLADVAELLTLLLRTSSTRETEAYLVASLRQDHFLLGDRARNVALGILIRSGVVQQNALSSSDLALFLEDVWQLHQSEDTDALPGSDEVARFVLRYS